MNENDTNADNLAPAPGAQTPTTPTMTSMEPKGKKSWIILAVIAVLVIAAAVVGWMMYAKEQARLAAPVKVGVLLPFTGGSTTAGYGELKGAQLAKKLLGADNVELIQEDSKCEGPDAKEAIKRLIAKGVVAIIGDACSGSSLEALPEANAAKVVLISPSATSPKLSVENDYFFRVVPPDQFQGQFAAKTMYDKGITSVATLYSNEAYGQGLSSAFVDAFKALGGTVVSENPYEDGVIDLTTQIAAMKAGSPKGIYFLGISSPSASAGLKQMREAGLTVPIYGGDSMYDAVILTNTPGAAEGMVLTTFSTGTQTFKQALKNAYADDNQTYAAAQAYDAFDALYRTIKDGARSGEEIKNKLGSVSFEGASGTIAFDKYGEIGNPDYEYALAEVKNGQFVIVE